MNDIVKERIAQDAQWGGPEHDDKHTPADWTQLVRKHNDRAYAAHHRGDLDLYRKQMVRVAALAIAALESFDRKSQK